MTQSGLFVIRDGERYAVPLEVEAKGPDAIEEWLGNQPSSADDGGDEDGEGEEE